MSIISRNRVGENIRTVRMEEQDVLRKRLKVYIKKNKIKKVAFAAQLQLSFGTLENFLLRKHIAYWLTLEKIKDYLDEYE